MAALIIAKNESNVRRENVNEDCVIDSTNNISRPFTFTVFDLAILILSVLSILIDMCTDLVLVVQYSNQGYKAWAISTFVLIFFPSVIVQFFSLRWHIVDETVNRLHWVLHFCMLGVVHRYVQVIKCAFSAYKSKNSTDVQKVWFDQSDLCMLHLFESFLESAPQLVLQIYVIVMLHEWRFWTGVSALASLLSLAWALAAYTKAQRRVRANKNSNTWPGLFLQAIWRAGMLTSRISTLVLGAYCFGNYIFILITVHWLTMTLWIICQKTDFCDTYWEEKIYNAVVGVIYCFCFFNLQEGQSRWRALVFYLVIIVQNLTCLTIYLMWFGDKTPKLAVSGFIAIVGGTIIGSTSMLFYYRFLHPSGPIKLFSSSHSTQAIDSSSPYSSMTLRSLKRIRCDNQTENFTKTSVQPDSKQVLNKSLDSVIVVEENVSEDSDSDIKILQNWIGASDNKLTVSTSKNETKETETDVYKRRAVCSSVDLVKLIESKTEFDNVSLKLEGTDEASSEVLSSHDYENLCAVNIAREAWGLRSWRGYSDIETWLHDDSVVHDRRLDTLTSTTSSDHSANILQKGSERTRQDDYIDAIAEDLAQCELEATSEDILGQYLIESLPVVYPLGALDPIFEEVEESSTDSTEFTDLKIRIGPASTLVATIDEIRRNTPIQSRYPPSESMYGFSDLSDMKPQNRNWKKVTFASKLLTFEQDDFVPGEVNKIINGETGRKNENAAVKDIKQEKKAIKIEEEISFKTQRKETNASTQKNLPAKSNNNFEIINKENIPTVASKINHWNLILDLQKERNNKFTAPKRERVSENKSLFSQRVLTPQKFSTFQIKKES